MFHPATSTNRYWNLFKTFLQTLVFWGVLLYVIPSFIAKIEFGAFEPMPVLGWIVFVLCGALGLYTGFTMSWKGEGTPLPTDCPRALVVSGPYQYVRNPMAVAGIGQGVAVALILGSSLVVLYALAGALLWHFAVRPIEEKDLKSRFGESYDEYKQTTRCWLPIKKSS